MTNLVDKAPIIILGASGQIGRALVARLAGYCVGLTRSEVDLTHLSRLSSYLDQYNPLAVINAAAYTQVDRAETEEALALHINGEVMWLYSTGHTETRTITQCKRCVR